MRCRYGGVHQGETGLLELSLAIVLSALAAAVVTWGVVRLRMRRAGLPPHFNQPLPYDDAFSRRTVTSTLDWYILRHLEDQRRVPIRQQFLDEDRQHNAILNHYVAHLLSKDNPDVVPSPSTLSETIRADDNSDYVPQYFPDADLDDSLAFLKHELIAGRLVSTSEYIQRIAATRAESLDAFDELKLEHTPFVPGAYAAFYNDLVAEADAFDYHSGIREKMRVLAVRMIFPATRKEFDYWKERELRTSQVPAPVARDAIEGWFYLDLEEVPIVNRQR